MKRQGGFTLIELVVVIVILGILAVTAAPRFLNIQDDARIAPLEGLSGAIQGAAGIVYGKAAIKGIESTSGAVSTGVGTNSINTIFGYPEATSGAIAAIVDGIGTDGDFVYKGKATDAVYFGIDSYNKKCVRYKQATSANTSAKSAVTDCPTK